VVSQYMDTLAVLNSGVTLQQNWGNMDNAQKLASIGQIGFWGLSTAVSARQAGGLKNLYDVQDIKNSLGKGKSQKQSQGKNDSSSELSHSETGYDRVYPHAGKKPRGMSENLEQIREKYGDRGVMTVTETQKKQDEIFKSGAGDGTRGPVVAGITGPGDTAPHFGQNFTKQEIRDGVGDAFFANIHPLLGDRLRIHDAKIKSGEVKMESPLSLDMAGISGHHAEIRALDEALKAYEIRTKKQVTEEDLPKFLLHNRSLQKQKDGTTRSDGSANKVPNMDGVPPRCLNCWHLTDGVAVIGND
jgi:hypothetical protein